MSLDLRWLSCRCKDLTDYLQNKVYSFDNGYCLFILTDFEKGGAADRHRENRSAASDWVTIQVEGTCDRHQKTITVLEFWRDHKSELSNNKSVKVV